MSVSTYKSIDRAVPVLHSPLSKFIPLSQTESRIHYKTSVTITSIDLIILDDRLEGEHRARLGTHPAGSRSPCASFGSIIAVNAGIRYPKTSSRRKNTVMTPRLPKRSSAAVHTMNTTRVGNTRPEVKRPL